MNIHIYEINILIYYIHIYNKHTKVVFAMLKSTLEKNIKPIKISFRVATCHIFAEYLVNAQYWGYQDKQDTFHCL